MTAKLEIQGLVKRFGPATVCDGIDMEVMSGQTVCLIGASGSGKSTLLRCVNLLEPVDDGRILLDGEDISAPGLDPQPVRSRIGMVFQSFNLFPHMTAIENVMLAPRRIRGMSRGELRPRAEELFGRFGLLEQADSYPDQLSGGQQQRIAIVRALAMEPEVMLFDEITSALDPQLVGEVLDVLHQLKREGMTMVVATHEMGFARQAADKVCFLSGGRVLEEGPPGRILARPERKETRAFLQRALK